MTITSNGVSYKVDTSKGFDLMRGLKPIAHFATLEAAKAEAARKRGTYIQYYLEKEG